MQIHSVPPMNLFCRRGSVALLGGIMSVFVFATLFAGCGTTSNSKPSRADLQKIGNEKFGHDRFAICIIPGSKGPIDEALVEGLSKTLGPSHLVRDTAENMRKVHAAKLDLLMCGVSPDKTAKVVRRSLAILGTNSLPGMRLHVVGIDMQDLEQAAHTARVELVK